MLKYISAASVITAAASTRSQTLEFRSAPDVIGEPFPDFLVRVRLQENVEAKARLTDALVAKIMAHGRALIEDSTVYFVYRGPARRVTVPSDLNGWNATADSMLPVEGTNLFFLAKTVNEAARFEYKFVVDSAWILDPLNRQIAMGGYGPNSEVWMRKYKPPEEIQYREDISHGTFDTLSFKSELLGRTHPVFVYLPPGYKNSRKLFPSIWVTDGGEYLSLALMNNVIDNMIAEKRIQPVVGFFIDPRTDVRDAGTSMRMHDYTMSDTFVTALTVELRPRLLEKYRVSLEPEQTAIMGASLGGLIASYAALKRPEVFGLAAAQSPAFWWKNGAIVNMVHTGPKRNVKFYIDTGTISDAQTESRQMKVALEEKGYSLSYGEYPEGHNWANWRARLENILTFFWGIQ